MKWNYVSEEEAEMSPDLFDMQIVLGLQHAETKNDVMKLLKDVRQHERLQIANKWSQAMEKLMTQDEKEEML